ncbi:MAG: hypothetical protein ACOY9Y_09010 [Bacillota bacterium]
MPDRWVDRNLEPKVNDILSKADAYHEQYYASETFSGPSLHFHRRALEVEYENWTEKIELIYAVLASWGMHRMGAKGSKMQPFTSFQKSVDSVKQEIETLRQTLPYNLSSSKWSALERVFKTIKVMASGTTIVGNSKVLAHLLPNLVAPVDREYTMNYLFGSKMFQNGLDREWRLMRKIHEEFYYPIADNQDFQKKAKTWTANNDSFPWDTSILKVIDNLVVGAMQESTDAD